MATIVTSTDTGKVLTPADVAAAFKVDVKTVTRWARTGKLASFKTPGGHRRYYQADVDVFLNDGQNGGAK